MNRIMHIRECRNCYEQFTTYDQDIRYCELCCYMETTTEYKERLATRQEELMELAG